MQLRFAALLAASLSVSTSFIAHAQTKPKNPVPLENRAEAQSIVKQLLKEGRIIDPKTVKRGMRGIAKSVFQGTKIEEFPIEVLGNLSNANGGGDIILIKVLGGPVVERQSGIIAGMSGSPVYINGKMLGAIALGWGFPKEPIGGVTPVTQMIESALPDSPNAKPKTAQNFVAPKLASTFTGDYTPDLPLKLAGKSIARVQVSRDRKRLALRGPDNSATMTMRPVSTLLQLNGFSQASLRRLQRLFEPYGVEPVLGIPSKKTGVKANLEPGAALGVQLVSGDMDQTAVGTVTFRWGRRLLAFGHPMFGQGTASLPMTTSYIHEIFPSYQRSFKLASPIDTVGALQQDTQFAIGGTVGSKADTIPMTVAIRQPDRQITKTYHVRVMKDPILTPQLLASVAAEAIETTLGQSSDKMVRVGLNMKIDGAQNVKRENLMYAQGAITGAALNDLLQTLSLSQSNEWTRGSISRVDLSVLVEPKRRTANIKTITADRNKVKAGETVGVRVDLEPTDAPGQIISKNFQFTVPADAPNGVLRIGASLAANYWNMQIRVGGAPPDPNNLPQLLQAWDKVGPFNELLVVASTPRRYLKVGQKKVEDVPPTFAALMKTAPISEVGLYNEVEVRREETEFMLDGTQLLLLPVTSLRQPDSSTTTPNENPLAVPPNDALPGGEVTTQAPDVPGAVDPGDPTPDPGDPNDPNNDPGDGNSFNAWKMAAWQRNEYSFVPEKSRFVNQIKALQRQSAQAQMWQRRVQALSSRGAMDVRMVMDERAQLAKSATHTAKMDAEPQQILNPTPTPIPTPTKAPGVGPLQTPTPIGGTPLATPTPIPTPSSKTLARPSQSWVQTPSDFLRGQFERSQVSSAGRLQLAPASQLLIKTSEPFVWSVAANSKGDTFLALTNPARIVKIAPDGDSSTLWRGDDLAVSALASDQSGNVYAGLTPSGNVLRIAPDGAATLILGTRQSFVGALEWDAQNRLLVGSGGEEGKLFRLDAPQNATAMQAGNIAPFATVPQKQIRAIATRGDDIFVGSGGEAVLYRIDNAGKAQALYQIGDRAKDTSDIEILGVAATENGVFFGASDSGTIYRWTKEDGAAAFYPSPQQRIFALRGAPNGKIYVATGDKGVVYEIEPGRTASESKAARLLEPPPSQSLALDLAPDGSLLVGTGNVGSVYRVSLNDKQSGVFTSTVFDAKSVVQWGALREIGRDVSIETRSGNTLDPGGEWSDWQAAVANGAAQFKVASPSARYLQYRATLQPNGKAMWDDDAASLSRVEIVYRAKNSAPLVAFALPKGGEFWSGKQKLTWAGQDTDNDALRYKLWLSSDDGASWQNVKLTKTTDNDFELDTTKYPDGTYRAKIEGSDAARNPDDPQSDEMISLPFVIDNSTPKISDARLVNADDGWKLSAVASNDLSPIAGAVWRWKPMGKPEAKKDEKKDGDKISDKDAKTSDAKTDATKAADKKASDKKDEVKADAKTDATKAATPKTATPKTTEPKIVKKEEDEDWNALTSVDGLFDSRREEIIGVVTRDEMPEDKDEQQVEIRVQSAAGKTQTITVPVP